MPYQRFEDNRYSLRVFIDITCLRAKDGSIPIEKYKTIFNISTKDLVQLMYS